MVMRRSAYVAALLRERAAIAARPGGGDPLRLAELDRELDRFADEPYFDGPAEVAVPGLISRSRRRSPRAAVPGAPAVRRRRNREVNRDAGTGEFVSDEFEASHPDTTVTEQVPGTPPSTEQD